MSLADRPHEVAQVLWAEYRAGNRRALNLLVESCAGLVYARIKGFLRQNADADDLWQTARIAVWEAAVKYDPARGTTFFSYINFYASQWAKRYAEIQAHCEGRYRRAMHEVIKNPEDYCEGILNELPTSSAPGQEEGAEACDRPLLLSPIDVEREAFLREFAEKVELDSILVGNTRQRDAFYRCLAGQDQRTIAEAQGVSHTTVGSDIRKAVTNLARAL